MLMPVSVQVALLVVMAQVGCFVPAEFMSLGIVDKLFTRMGTADSIENNCSTFMAEMHDTAHIIDNVTSRWVSTWAVISTVSTTLRCNIAQ